jgi:hypothetical protein
MSGDQGAASKSERCILTAIVVFASVEAAIAVKKCLDALRDKAEENSAFYGLQTTFSKDPCVQPLNLISDLQQ